MWGYFAAGGVALAIVFAAGWWMLRSARRKGEQNVRDQEIKDAATVAGAQRDIAADAPAHRDELLGGMRDGKL
jgi:hypothetical protein